MSNKPSLSPRIEALLNLNAVTPLLNREDLFDLPVNSLKGIGPVYQSRLKQIDVINIEQLSQITSKEVSQELQIPLRLLEKFCLSARIITYYAEFGDEEKEPQRKIVLAGLNSAGKTSIIRSIQNMQTYEHTRATLGVKVDQFDLVGKKVSIWDLGGQTTFRDIFTRPNSVQFSGLSLLVFVFDIQARSRALEGLEYFERSLNVSNFLHHTPKIVIFFHKYDRTRGESLQRHFEGNKQHLLMRINTLKERYKVPEFMSFDTSIYDIPGLIQAFSKSLTYISPVANILNDTLEFYSREQGVLGTFLISDNGLILAEYLGELSKKIRDESLIQAMVGIQKNPDAQIFHEKMESGLFTKIEKLSINNHQMSLVTINKGSSTVATGDGGTLNEILSPWIANLFASL